MPGIAGLISKQNSNNVSGFLSTMLASFSYAETYQKETFVDVATGVALGRLHLGIFDYGVQPVYSKDKRLVILFDGELYDNLSGKSDPEFVLERYQRLQENGVKGIDGSYAFVIVDYNQKVLKIFSDHFGLKPVYYYQSLSQFVFASEVKAILPLHEGPKRRDNKTIADFFTFGFPIGDETLFEDIKLLPAASCLTYDLNSKNMSIQKYWCLIDLFTPKGKHDLKLQHQEVVDAFIKAVDRRLSYSDQLGLSLSGGLDSRSILAAMGDRAKGLKTYTVGLKNCRDEVLAKRMSEITNTSHTFVEINGKYLNHFREVANQYIYLTDGFYHPRELTEIQVLQYLQTAPFKILLRGHGGEFAKAALAFPVKVNKELLSLKDGKDILNWIVAENKKSFGAMLDLDYFLDAPFYENIKNDPHKSLTQELIEPLDLLDPGDVALYFYMDQFSRRLSMPCMDIFRTQVEIRMPFFDLQFLKLLFQMPVQSRWNGNIQHQIVKHCDPRLMQIVDSNTGATLDAAPWQTYLYDKLNTLLMRLSLHGFRHYTEFDEWQRNHFASDIVNILFSDKSADRGIYDLKHVREAFSRHINRKANFANFLGTAVGIELWHQRFVD